MADPRLVLMAVVFAILLPRWHEVDDSTIQEFSEEESNIAEGVTVWLFQKKTAESVVQPTALHIKWSRRGGWFKKINLLINTTPALRATPPRLRREVYGSRSDFTCKASAHRSAWEKSKIQWSGAMAKGAFRSSPL